MLPNPDQKPAAAAEPAVAKPAPAKPAAAERWRLRDQIGALSVRYLPVVAWVLTMISIPIVRWVSGDGVLHWGVILGVLLQATAVLVLLQYAWGWRETVRVFLIVTPLAWLVEYIGSTTGFPFGVYHYTPALAPLLGGVPLVIPLAWLMMLPPAWAVASAITGQHSGWRFLVVTALAFTAWDLFLDPQMVAWGYWVWAEPGAYFGIPLVNFGGWLLCSALITLAVRPQQPPVLPLLIIYTITWFLQSVGLALFWGMVGPALAGFVGMGVFVVWSLLCLRSHSGQP